jgi:hypothetical protein
LDAPDFREDFNQEDLQHLLSQQLLEWIGRDINIRSNAMEWEATTIQDLWLQWYQVATVAQLPAELQQPYRYPISLLGNSNADAAKSTAESLHGDLIKRDLMNTELSSFYNGFPLSFLWEELLGAPLP